VDAKYSTLELGLLKYLFFTGISCSNSNCGNAHNGFLQPYTSIQDDILVKAKILLQEAVDNSASFPDCKFVVIIGHSLGAALATVATFDLAQTESLNLIVGGDVASKALAKKIIHISWEGPAVGNSDFVAR
jgi:predicted lipase